MIRPKRKLLQQRKELVERYTQRLVRRKISRFARAVARRLLRPQLQWGERKRKRMLAATLETVAFEAGRARKNGFESTASVLNLGLFFLIAERDIQAMKIDALTHPDPWQRSLAARVILLTIHELDIDKAAGNKLRQVYQDGQVPQDIQDAVTDAMRTIRKAQNRAQRQFADLRNSTIAHRDSDAVRQYRNIIDIENAEVIQAAAEFYLGTHLFMDALPRLITHLGTWPGMFAQLEAQSNRNLTSGASRVP